MAKRSGKLARRYARALLVVARRELGAAEGVGAIQKFAEELNLFAQTFSSHRELQHAMLSPMFPRAGRAKALQALAEAAALPELAKRALQLLFERERIAYLPEIADAFVELANQEGKITDVEVTTAQPLEDGERERVEGSLKKCIAGNPRFSWHVQGEILGGMIVCYDGKVIDGSVRGRLSRLERELTR